jgi:hypothetical protein
MFDMECGGKREHGRDAAFMQRDSRRLGLSSASARLKAVSPLRSATVLHKRAAQKMKRAPNRRDFAI